jgi:prepilin-type processing-associated H-X9-DG protein
MLESGIELAITAWRTAMITARTFDEDMPEMPQVLYELARGYLRTLLPTIEEDKLIFKQPEGLGFLESVVLMDAPEMMWMWWNGYGDFGFSFTSKCSKHLKQIVLALHTHHDAFNAFPPLYTVDEKGKPLHSWRVLILPFIEQNALYEKIRLDEPWDSEHNKQFHNVVVPVYACPKNKTEGTKNCHYSVIAGGIFTRAKKAGDHTGSGFGDIQDGTSNTIALVEVKEGFCWMDPSADVTLEELVMGINVEGGWVGGKHSGGINVAMFDGSVHFLPNETPRGTLHGLATPNGGENNVLLP